MSRRWWGSVRAAARIAWRDAARATGRTGFVVAMVALPIAAAAAIAVLGASSEPSAATTVAQELGPSAQARLVVAGGGPDEGDGMVQPPGEDPLETPTIAQIEDQLAAVLPAQNDLERVLWFTAIVEADGGRVADAHALERSSVRPELDFLAPIDNGLAPQGSHAVALSHDLAESLGVGIGDTVRIARDVWGSHDEELRAFTVTGLTDSTGPDVITDAGALYPTDAELSSGVAQNEANWFSLGPQDVRRTDALTALGAGVISRADRLDPLPEALARQEARAREGGLSVDALAQVGGLVAVGLLEVVLLIGPAFAVGARRSERQLALVAATGGDRSDLRRVVLLGGWLLGILAAVCGVVAGMLLALAIRWFVRRGDPWAYVDVRVPELQLLAVAAIGTLIAVAAAWLPARRAGRTDVVAALAGRRALVSDRGRMSVLGPVLAGIGVGAAALGAVARTPMLLIPGVVALLAGVVMSTGPAVSVVSRFAGQLGPAGRFALRDAARQRGRTAPAVGAVTAAVAAVVALGCFGVSAEALDRANYRPLAGEGVVAVRVEPGTSDEQFDEAVRALTSELPIESAARVRLAGVGSSSLDDDVRSESGTGARPSVRAIPDPGLSCPDDAGDDAGGEPADPRCTPVLMPVHLWSDDPSVSDALVDDGTTVALLGVDGAVEAAAALSEGKVVVTSPAALWPDDTVHVGVTMPHAGSAADAAEREAVLPGVLLDVSGAFAMALPTTSLPRLGLEERDVGLVASTSRMPSEGEEAAADLAVSAVLSGSVHVERGYRGEWAPNLAILVAVAAIVCVAASGIVVALAAADSRPDMATMAAVGADPTTHRRIGGAQAGVVTGIGGSLGAILGLGLAWVYILSKRAEAIASADLEGLAWALHVPWSVLVAVVLGIPALTMVGAWALTRSRLPMTRRLAG